jgi:Uma2 family endonuclease
MTIRITNAAEGLPRYAFTVAEVEAMVAAGIIAQDERIELIEGELVPMSPKGIRHEVVRYAFTKWWSRRLSERHGVLVETTLRLAEKVYVEPDILVFDDSVGLRRLGAATVLLAVEIADTSLAYDLGTKAAIYAAHGVGELWVVDANTVETHVHRDPVGGAYTSVTTHAAGALLTPRLVPEAALRLTDLDLLDLRDD